MGFSTIVSQVIFFSFMLVVLVGIFIISKGTLLEDKETLETKGDMVVERINTQIDIENVTYSSGTTTMLVRNQGSTTLKITLLDIYLNQNRILRNSTDITITVMAPDITNPGLWDPDELIQIDYDENLADGNYTVSVVTEYSIMDAKNFEIT